MSHAAARPADDPRATSLLHITAWCAACGRQERVLTAREAAERCSVSTRTIYRWADSGRLHRVETPAQIFICFNSLYC